MADLVYQYKTNKGFYINQYANGQFGLAFSGDVQVGQSVWSGKTGVKISVTDPANSSVIGEFAFGIQTGSIGPVTTAQKTIIDVLTGLEKQVTEVTFNAPIPILSKPAGPQISIYEKTTQILDPNKNIYFEEGGSTFGLAATVGTGKLPNGSTAAIGVKLDIQVPNYSIDVDTHYTPQPNGDIIVTKFNNNSTFSTKIYSSDGVEIGSHAGRYMPLDYIMKYKMGNCFSAGTQISMADGRTKAIEDIAVGDTVLAFSELQPEAGLRSCVVTQVFSNVTDEWLVVRPSVGFEAVALRNGFSEVTVTPGHEFLTATGAFRRIDQIVLENDRIVLADRSTLPVRAERVVYSAENAGAYDFGQVVEYGRAGNLALKAEPKGWRTYNFEVANTHTYIANGIRVHNECPLVLVVESNDVANVLGGFDGTQASAAQIVDAIADGRLKSVSYYVDASSLDQYTGSVFDSPNKIVVSGDESGLAVSTVSNGFLQHITSFPANGTKIDTAFAPGGSQLVTTTDTTGQFGWNREITAIHPDFIDKIVVNDNNAVASATWNGAQVSGNIGAAFGSNIGAYLGQLIGGNNLAVKVGAGTLGGAIGKELGQALYLSATYSLDAVVAQGLANVPGGFVGGLPGAAVGALSSALIGELADKLQLPGFVGGALQSVSGSVTNQLVTNAFGIFSQQINQATGAAYTLFDGFNTVEFTSGLSGAIGGSLGGALHAAIALPQYPEGAVGQHLGAAIGSALGTLVATAIVAGPVGAFVFGAISAFVGSGFGTFIGDAFAPEAEAHGDLQFDPATHHFIVDEHTYGQVRSKSASGYYMVAQYQANVINGLADFAGAQLDGVRTINTPFGSYSVFEKLHFKQQGLNYYLSEETLNPFIAIAALDPRQALTPMADAGIMQVVHNTHISGGDPLLRLAWDNSHADNPTAFSFDLQIARHDRRRRGASKMQRGAAFLKKAATKAERRRAA